MKSPKFSDTDLHDTNKLFKLFSKFSSHVESRIKELDFGFRGRGYITEDFSDYLHPFEIPYCYRSLNQEKKYSYRAITKNGLDVIKGVKSIVPVDLFEVVYRGDIHIKKSVGEISGNELGMAFTKCVEDIAQGIAKAEDLACEPLKDFGGQVIIGIKRGIDVLPAMSDDSDYIDFVAYKLISAASFKEA